MAQKNPIELRMRMKFETGVVDGKPTYRTRTFNNIAMEATDANILACAQAIESLSAESLVSVDRIDEGRITAL